FAGIPITAYAPDSVVTVEMDEDTFTVETGAGGETTRVMSHNRNAKVTIELMASSAENDDLSAIHAQDRLTGDGVGIYDGRELDGGTSVHGEAFIVRMPSVERKKGAPTVTWQIQVVDAEINHGGFAV